MLNEPLLVRMAPGERKDLAYLADKKSKGLAATVRELVVKSAAQTRLEEIVEKLNWQPDDGPTAGVWERNRPGHRCLWSCRWSTSTGQLLPHELVPAPDMSAVQAIVELQDILARKPSPEGERCLAALLDESIVCIPPAIDQARDFIGKARAHYSEYIAPWDIQTSRIFADLWRPGWEVTKEK
jgi:hypothetical protein